MNPRFQPADDRRAFYERVQAEQGEILAALKATVSTWTENEIIGGNYDERSFICFLDKYPEWNHETLYATITEEMERVRYELLGASKAI